MAQLYKFRIKTKNGDTRHTDIIWATNLADARQVWLDTIGKAAPQSTPMFVSYNPITPADLKYMVENRGTESHFFSRANMRFSGDTMGNYGVRSQPIIVQTCHGTVLAWELYRKNAVKHGLKKSAFFAVDTLHQVFES